MISPKSYALTKDGKTVVEETDPRAHCLLVGKGCEIADAVAAQYEFPADEPAADEPAADEPKTRKSK